MENEAKNLQAFKVTESAAEKFKEIIESMEERPGGVRIFNSGGCCGSSVQMELAESIQAGELQVDIEGVAFFVSGSFLRELETVTIDFVDEGFRLLGYNSPQGCCSGH